MNVVHDLRMPYVVQFRHGEPRLLLGEGVPVTVVVVPHIVVVQERRPAPLPRPPERALVPVHHQLAAVGVQRRHQQQDDPVQDHPRRGVIARGQMVHQPHGHLVATHLGGVDPTGDQYDRPALGDQLLGLLLRRHPPRIGQLALDVQVMVQTRQVVGAGDGERHERPIQRSGAQRVQPHPRARRRQLSQVAGDLGPVRQLAIGAHPEAQHFRR